MQRRLPTIINRIAATLSPNTGPHNIFPVSDQCFKRNSISSISNDKGTEPWYDIGHNATKNCNLLVAYSLSTHLINISNDIGRGDVSGRDNASSKCTLMPETRYLGDEIGCIDKLSNITSSLRISSSGSTSFRLNIEAKVFQSPFSTSALDNGARFNLTNILIDSIMVRATRPQSN